MQFYISIVYLVVLLWSVMSQVPYAYSNQYGSSGVIGAIPQEQDSPSSIVNQLQPSVYTQITTIPSNEHYLVGNLSERFTFPVAPPTVKVTQLDLNGFSLYRMGVEFSNKSKFHYDEQNNTLTILSLDSTTVGYYSAVDSNSKTYINIVSAINVSSFSITNSHINEDNNSASLVSCSVSIIRSTIKSTQPSLQTKPLGTAYLPRLDLFISTRQPFLSSSVFSSKKIYNDTLNEQNFTRTITIQGPLTRADHNETIQCQVKSTNNNDIYLIKTVSIDIEYGPNLETGALSRTNLEGEVLQIIALECQIEANPSPFYVWYALMNNISTSSLIVFATTRQIQRIYQYPGLYAMQCQAQSRGKTITQEFFISVLPQSNSMKNHQTSTFPSFRLSPAPTDSYSPEQDEDISTSINPMALTTATHSQTNTPLFGSHKSLSQPIQSLRSNQQPSISLLVQKRSTDLPKKSSDIKKKNIIIIIQPN